MSESTTIPAPLPSLSHTARWVILCAGFLGWLCAGMHMSITQLSGQPAAIDLLNRVGVLDADRYLILNRQFQVHKNASGLPPGLSIVDEQAWQDGKTQVAQWFAWYQCAFLFGAAAGGLLFGWLGDSIGRSKGMTASILTYSAFAGACYFAESPVQLLVLWFLACTGVGGMWPNGVALVSEAWQGMSRPLVAGVIGTSANIGIFLVASLATVLPITPSDWRWTMLVGAAPLLLGIFALLAVPESPRWLATRGQRQADQPAPPAAPGVFRPPLLQVTLVGIVLATVPLIGGWGSANWMIPWADQAGQGASPPNPYLKAQVGQVRAFTGIVGSLLGGWIASVVGRRRSFFLVSLFSLLIAQYTFWQLYPTDPGFLLWVGALGFFSGIYFGWLPLCLPELFPTAVRSTGSGVSFNFGRIVTASTIFTAGALMELFGGNYALIGRATSLIFLLGMLIICFAPDTSEKQLMD